MHHVVTTDKPSYTKGKTKDGSYGLSAEVQLPFTMTNHTCIAFTGHAPTSHHGFWQLKRKMDLKYDTDLEDVLTEWIEEVSSCARRLLRVAVIALC